MVKLTAHESLSYETLRRRLITPYQIGWVDTAAEARHFNGLVINAAEPSERISAKNGALGRIEWRFRSPHAIGPFRM
jgi:hypothetical protein